MTDLVPARRQDVTAWPRRVFAGLVACSALLLAAHALIDEQLSWTLHRLFDLDKEANVPTWFAANLLFAVAVAAALLGARNQAPGSIGRVFWLFFAAAYAFLSLDEVAQLHEWIDRNTSVKWVFAYAPAAGLFFVACCVYLLGAASADRGLAPWILGGLGVYAAGGLGVELLDHVGRRQGWMTSSIDHVQVMFEEGLELLGSTVVLTGCLTGLTRDPFREGQAGRQVSIAPPVSSRVPAPSAEPEPEPEPAGTRTAGR